MLFPLKPVRKSLAWELAGTLLWPGSVLGPSTRNPGALGGTTVSVWLRLVVPACAEMTYLPCGQEGSIAGTQSKLVHSFR